MKLIMIVSMFLFLYSGRGFAEEKVCVLEKHEYWNCHLWHHGRCVGATGSYNILKLYLGGANRPLRTYGRYEHDEYRQDLIKLKNQGLCLVVFEESVSHL